MQIRSPKITPRRLSLSTPFWREGRKLTSQFTLNLGAAITAACLLGLASASAGTVKWISSTADQPWKEMPTPSVVPVRLDAPPNIRIAPNKTYQSIDGFGGCFNELGWVALGKASQADQKKVLASLFGEDGCAFTMGRLPIGASDFALDWYSLDETPGDLELKHFTLDRDEKYLIPFVKAAMTIRPDLKCWGSAWSPPSWMKENNNYSKGSLRWEPAILHSYANYLARWVEGYRKEGINVFAVFTQNEPNILNIYPTTLWKAQQLREFVADYLGPTLLDRKTNVQLWLGTLNDGNFNDRLVTVLQDPKANLFITGISFQYDGKQQIGSASQLYPDKKLMQSETECNNGANSWADAIRLFDLMRHYLGNGANSYFMWNMVLNETGMSTWNWKQNAMITVDQKTGAVTYNGEYYVMRHFSQFIKPGAKRVLTTGLWTQQIAFTNPDGSTVLVVANSSKEDKPVVLALANRPEGSAIEVTLPKSSVNTFLFP